MDNMDSLAYKANFIISRLSLFSSTLGYMRGVDVIRKQLADLIGEELLSGKDIETILKELSVDE